MLCRYLLPWLAVTLALTLPTLWYLSGFESGEEDIWIGALLLGVNAIGAIFIVRYWRRRS